MAETEICIVDFAMASIDIRRTSNFYLYMFYFVPKDIVSITVQTDFCLLKKREFVFSAALPFLLILHESVEGFRAEAAE